MQPTSTRNNGGAPTWQPTANQVSTREDRGATRFLIIGVVVALVVLALIIGAVIYLIQPTSPTERIRDIFIIFMALISMLLGVALVILIVQIASLINLLQNEIKPILESTNETANTLRGTTQFLSDHLTEPVIKLGQATAALRTLFGFQSLFREKRK